MLRDSGAVPGCGLGRFFSVVKRERPCSNQHALPRRAINEESARSENLEQIGVLLLRLKNESVPGSGYFQLVGEKRRERRGRIRRG